MLTVALPAIISKLVEWGLAFGKWVATDAIPFLLTELAGLLLALGEWIIGTALPSIVNKLIDWGEAFYEWIVKDVLPSLPGELEKIITKIGGWIGDNAGRAATAAVDLGLAVLQGIADGIRDNASRIVGAAVSYVTGLLPGWVKDGLGIGSPSRVMIPIGMEISHGIAVGIRDGGRKYVRPVLDDLAKYVATYPIPLPHPGGVRPLA